MRDKIDLVPGKALQRILGHIAADHGDKKIQDTIRDILVHSPIVVEYAERYGEDLDRDKPARGGYRGGKKSAQAEIDPTYENIEDRTMKPAMPRFPAHDGPKPAPKPGSKK